MARVPDVCIVNFWRLNAAEIKAFSFYCARRNDIDGGFEIDDKWVVRDMRMSRSRVTEARNGLEEKGWIKIMYVRDTKYFIAPFFGFVVENSTYLDEISTKRVENSTRPLKELPAKLPAKLPREGADDSAPPAQNALPDEKSKKSQPAGKPAKLAAPTKTRKRKSSAPRPPARRKPVDTSNDHPAVQMIREITGRFPNKDLWNRISKEIGSEPNADFFLKSFVQWRSFGGNPQNYEQWLFIPNKTGKIPETYGANGSGNGGAKPPDVPKFEPPPTDKKLDEKQLLQNLEILRELLGYGESIDHWKDSYAPGDWAWLMENLQK